MLSNTTLDETKLMLEKRIAWEYFLHDEFISFMSSLLWALQLAVCKTRNKNNDENYDEKQIHICYVKTSQLSQDTKKVLYFAPDLAEIYCISDEGKLRHSYHQAEYIFYGKMSVAECSRAVSLKALRQAGLFDLIAELDDEAFKKQL
ncbi:hypothetical protein MMC21_003635 [Puttea exsequens]|nr:hypothetical protein [Puttea exsequens]